MTETEVNNLKNMCKTDPHLKGFVTEVTDEKQGTSNQFRVTIATKKGARVFHSWSEFQQWRLGLAKIVLLSSIFRDRLPQLERALQEKHMR